MRNVISSAFVSVDGVMQAPGAPQEDPTGGFPFGGWLFEHWDEDTDAFMTDLFAEPFDLLLGRKTYEIFAAFWPFMDDSIAKAFNAATKYVATRSDLPLTWENSVRLSDAVADIARLKREEGRRLLIQGSANLIQSLQQASLVDEYHILTFPVVLGQGKRLFETGVAPGKLRLTRHKLTAKGAMLASYVPSGPIVVGSFAEDNPSDLELARRQKWNREG